MIENLTRQSHFPVPLSPNLLLSLFRVVLEISLATQIYRYPQLKTIESKTCNILFSRFIVGVAGVVAGKVVVDKPAVDVAVVGMVMAMSVAHMAAVDMTAVGMAGPIRLGRHCSEGNRLEVAVAASDTFQHQPVRQPRLGQDRKNPR